MLIGCVQVAWVYLVVSTWLQFVVADADFIDVRLKLEKDRSGKRGDPKDKYFREPILLLSDITELLLTGLSQMNPRSLIL